MWPTIDNKIICLGTPFTTIDIVAVRSIGFITGLVACGYLDVDVDPKFYDRWWDLEQLWHLYFERHIDEGCAGPRQLI